jgi:hypothetical protein
MPRSGVRRLVRAPLLVVVLLAPLLAALAPTAQAQVGLVDSQLAVSVPDPGGGLSPGSETSVLVLITYNAGPGRQPALDPASGEVPTRVRLEVVQKPSWVNATRFEPEVANLTVRPVSGNSAGNVTLFLTVAADAPARVREDLVVKATAEPNGNIRGSTAESAPIKLRARVVTKVNVTAASESPVFVSGGRWTSVPFVVRNEGNDEVTAILNVTTRPEDSQIDLPETTLVLPRGGSATVEVGLRMPWTYGSLGTLELEAQPLSEDEEPKAARAFVDVNAQSAVPGAPPAVLALACVAAALVARRLRARR